MIKHHFSDHLYAKECFIPAGSILVQHKHEYDHLSILAKGRIKEEDIVQAPEKKKEEPIRDSGEEKK